MILLSFDIEEFDMPFEYGRDIPFEEQMSVSKEGTKKILRLLAKYKVCATFYITANFALHAPEIVRQIAAEGHEIASHGFYHSEFQVDHLIKSKEVLEKIGNTKIEGYRMARLFPISATDIREAGYVYNSSINPTFLPGRYNHLNKPRTWFVEEGVYQLPVSVAPLIRFPLFWLSFHNLPLRVYWWFAKRAYKKDHYLNIYFHPWEFTSIGPKERFNIPSYITKNEGEKMELRLEKFILWAKKEGYPFGLTKDFVQTIQ